MRFATVSRAQLLRPYPQYDGVSAFRVPGSESIYHGLTMRLDKRFSNGLSLLSAYTRGKLVDDASTTVGFLGQAGAQQDAYDRAADRSISSQDISYRLVTGFIYDLPFGRDRKFGSDWSGPVNWVLGGWQVNGIATFQSGYPLLITQGVNNTNLFSPSQRPTWNGEDATISDGSTADRLQRWFDTSDYSVTPAFRFGNTPRVTDSAGDGMKNLDFSLFKNNYLQRRKIERAAPHRDVQRAQPGAVQPPEHAGWQRQLRRRQRPGQRPASDSDGDQADLLIDPMNL